jgi:DUF1707 SHOCT-like domain
VTLRVSDSEREAVVATLREHFFAGRLSVDEFTERVERAYSARTAGDLAAVDDDLPALEGVSRRRRKPWLVPGNTSFAVRIHTRKPLVASVDAALAAFFPKLAGSGYHPETEEPSKRVYVRDERAAWTIVVAVLLFPLGLLALLARSRSHVTVQASEVERGVTAVDIYGTAPLAVRRAVRDLAATPESP